MSEDRLTNLVSRFQSLAAKTGTDKSGSYGVSVHFCHFDKTVTLGLFTYDISDWPRHTIIDNIPIDKWLDELESVVIKAEMAVEDE